MAKASLRRIQVYVSICFSLSLSVYGVETELTSPTQNSVNKLTVKDLFTTANKNHRVNDKD